MTMNRVVGVVLGTGVCTIFATWIGLDSIGALFALIQLGFFVGAPLAYALHRIVRLLPITIVLSVTMSMAVSSLASQSLIWFEIATSATIVAAATVYGVALGLLFQSEDSTLAAGSVR